MTHSHPDSSLSQLDARPELRFTAATMPAQPNQSLIDGLRCLELLVSHGAPIGSREMAKILGIEPTRANRLLGTLAHLGLAEQNAERKYRPGSGVHVLAAQSVQGSHLLPAALPHLTKLREDDLTVALGVLWQQQVCFLLHARAAMPLESSIGTHHLEPLGHSSIGVVLLASRADALEIARAENRSSETHGWPDETLAQAVRFARKSGFARLSFPREVVSLAVPIGTPPVAGLAVSGILRQEQIPAIVAKLQGAAQDIARDLDAMEKRDLRI